MHAQMKLFNATLQAIVLNQVVLIKPILTSLILGSVPSMICPLSRADVYFGKAVH